MRHGQDDPKHEAEHVPVAIATIAHQVKATCREDRIHKSCKYSERRNSCVCIQTTYCTGHSNATCSAVLQCAFVTQGLQVSSAYPFPKKGETRLIWRDDVCISSGRKQQLLRVSTRRFPTEIEKMLRRGVAGLVAAGARRTDLGAASKQLAVANLKRSIANTAVLQYARCASATAFPLLCAACVETCRMLLSS